MGLGKSNKKVWISFFTYIYLEFKSDDLLKNLWEMVTWDYWGNSLRILLILFFIFCLRGFLSVFRRKLLLYFSGFWVFLWFSPNFEFFLALKFSYNFFWIFFKLKNFLALFLTLFKIISFHRSFYDVADDYSKF